MPESTTPLPAPEPAGWASIGLRCLGELTGGHQSRVFRVESDGEILVAKLTDRHFVDGFAHQRLALVDQLSRIDETVVGPISRAGELTSTIGQWDVVLYPEVVGSIPDLASERDVSAMALALAGLHGSMRSVDGAQLPVVAAMRVTDVAPVSGSEQLIHGDYAPSNMRLTADGPRVLDFDDCGRGDATFEVGNTLYMAMFDVRVAQSRAASGAGPGGAGDGRRDDYDRFRSWFVSAYRLASGLSLPDFELDRSIATRVEALRRWLDEPASAPVGINSASDEWKQVLRRFVDGFGSPIE